MLSIFHIDALIFVSLHQKLKTLMFNASDISVCNFPHLLLQLSLLTSSMTASQSFLQYWTYIQRQVRKKKRFLFVLILVLFASSHRSNTKDQITNFSTYNFSQTFSQVLLRSQKNIIFTTPLSKRFKIENVPNQTNSKKILLS